MYDAEAGPSSSGKVIVVPTAKEHSDTAECGVSEKRIIANTVKQESLNVPSSRQRSAEQDLPGRPTGDDPNASGNPGGKSGGVRSKDQKVGAMKDQATARNAVEEPQMAKLVKALQSGLGMLDAKLDKIEENLSARLFLLEGRVKILEASTQKQK